MGFSIKVLVGGERIMVGKAGKPTIYKTKKLAQEQANKISKKMEARVVPSIPVHELK